MNEPINNSNSPGQSPVCPHCGLLLRIKGKIVDLGTMKKWVEEWHCRIHGQIKVPEKQSN